MEIMLETPSWAMVTPYRTSAISMVRLLCVMTMNCVFSANSFTMRINRPTLASSSGASTSSKRQKGLGFTIKKAKSTAIAVSAFSPPESNAIFCSFLPGGWTKISIPVSKG